MVNLDDITNENNEEHNEKWPYIPDHPYRICGGRTCIELVAQNKEKQMYCLI